MERSIRIGKDFNVRWSINKVVDGERQPYELAGKELVLQYRTPYGLKEATEWKTEGNTIVWTFRGKEQKALGSHDLILTENGGKDGMVTVDTCRAFKLVAHSCEETDGSGGDIVIEDVVLESEVAFAPIIKEGGEPYDDTELKKSIADLQAKDKATDAKLTELSERIDEIGEGAVGPQGPQGEQGPAGPQGPKGDQGNSGYTGAAGELEVVNNLTQGGATAALSAEMGKVLGEELQGKAKDIDLEVWYNGEYVAFESTFLVTNSAYDVFRPILLKKGDILVYKTLCSAAISELVKVNDHESAAPSFVPLVKGRATYDDEYTYIIEEDGYYALGGRDSVTYPAYITKAYVIGKGLVAKVEGLESEVAELRSASSTHDVLLGKKYVACGDSFTACTNAQFTEGIYNGRDKTYPYLIGLRTGMEVNNMAVSGMSLVKKEGSDNYFSGAYFKGIPTDADYITIKLGINDVNYGSPIGTINDSDNTTFYGAWNVVMSYLIANYPYAKIGIIVTNGASDEVMEAERAIAKKWGVPFLDYGDYQTPLMGRMSGFRDGVVSEAMQARHNAFRISDTDTHPNAKAHEYESTFIEAFLRRL